MDSGVGVGGKPRELYSIFEITRSWKQQDCFDNCLSGGRESFHWPTKKKCLIVVSIPKESWDVCFEVHEMLVLLRDYDFFPFFTVF